MKSPSALRRERITALTLREPERIAASRPRSAALARRSAEHLLFDVPMHWMSDWARLSHLHAAVRVEAHDSQWLEQLCRYISRPALSDERAQINAAGQVDLKLKTPRRDGNTNLVMSPLVFVHRLAAPGLARDCPGQGLLPGCQSRQSDARFGSSRVGRPDRDRSFTAGRQCGSASGCCSMLR